MEPEMQKLAALEQLNEKLTQLHWIVAQVAGENDLHTMYNLILNGFMQIAEVPGCHFILLDESSKPSETVRRCNTNSSTCPCTAPHDFTFLQKQTRVAAWSLPHPDFCGNCQGNCNMKVLQVFTLHGRTGDPLALLCALDNKHPEFNEETNMILELFTIQVSLALENAILTKRLQNLSVTDALTGLYNHRYFAEQLQKELKKSCETSSNLSLIMIDVDNFKGYNDTYGHPAGDLVLRTMGKILKENSRPCDMPARYGGEEFALILPNTPISEGINLAEDIRNTIEKTNFPHRLVTASIGIACFPRHTTRSTDLLKLADKALYQAKASGKNKVCIAENMLI